ncbi:MAG: transcription factor IIA subunit alpha [Thelocarpon impressellum]|nr:MAG: transcription factor IIA subunit alpha [Thelocarpon impressellum]
MSNQLVGPIYQRIITDVIESSQVDFEEGGVDASTLDELKQVWQNKLSSLNCAQFPWDPAPAAAQIANPAPVPSNGPSARATAASASNAGGIKVKTEPGAESGLPAVTNPQAAAQRAANLMAQKFGNNQAGISASASTAPAGAPGARPPTSGPGQTPSSNAATSHQQQPQVPIKKQQPPNGVAGAQTDGAGEAGEEWSAVMKRRNAEGEDEEIGRIEVDGMIRRHVEEMGLRMEGGGLMLPLSERRKAAKGKKRKITMATAAATVAAVPTSSPSIPQLDGGIESDSDGKENIKGEEDDEIDEDAINSDLDDPDENGPADSDDDEAMTQIMLCMYDKVQRVKNKWKCTLKDGVLSVNGKEYVFHKATGEFEW